MGLSINDVTIWGEVSKKVKKGDGGEGLLPSDTTVLSVTYDVRVKSPKIEKIMSFLFLKGALL